MSRLLLAHEEYTETIVCKRPNCILSAVTLNKPFFAAKAIDRYIEIRSTESSSSKVKMDSRLQTIIEGILHRCIEEGEHKQVRSTSTPRAQSDSGSRVLLLCSVTNARAAHVGCRHCPRGAPLGPRSPNLQPRQGHLPFVLYHGCRFGQHKRLLVVPG